MQHFSFEHVTQYFIIRVFMHFYQRPFFQAGMINQGNWTKGSILSVFIFEDLPRTESLYRE